MLQLLNQSIQLIPLSYEQLLLLPDNRPAFYETLGIDHYPFSIDPAFLEELEGAFRQYIPEQVKNNPDNYLWYTHWLILHRDHNRWIGGIGTNGLPNEKGENMIGYYIEDQYAGKGYATQAVNLFCQWLRQQAITQTIYATTPPGHTGSEKVLQKNGFRYAGEGEEGTNRWELSCS